jgi:RNA polymerase sigma factor (sigma-70 family)
MPKAQLARVSLGPEEPTGPNAQTEPTDRQLLERFLSRKDEAAFAALVRRYGPLVLSVCRRVLDRIQDAEDAFQATFLVLVRKGWSIGNPELLGNWLYGVAYRVARKARVRAARRREQERQAEPMVVSDPSDAVSWDEMRTALDEELHRLPEKYRQPLVLCYLQGLTNEEAARRLGWPAGSMSYRLGRAREMLRDRLTGRLRGAPPASFGLMLALGAGNAALPSRLVDATVHSATLFGAGKAAGGVSAGVGSLVEAALRAMGIPWRKLLGTIGLILIAVGVASGTVAYFSWPAQPDAPETALPQPSTNEPPQQPTSAPCHP